MQFNKFITLEKTQIKINQQENFHLLQTTLKKFSFFAQTISFMYFLFRTNTSQMINVNFANIHLSLSSAYTQEARSNKKSVKKQCEMRET